MALILGLSRAICPRNAAMTSRAEIDRRRIEASSSRALVKQRSAIHVCAHNYGIVESTKE